MDKNSELSWWDRNGTTTIIVSIIVGLCLFMGGCVATKNNNIITMNNLVEGAAADIAAQYQRRANLLPNLVTVVEAAGLQERDTLREVMEARASASKVSIDISKATPEQIAQFQAQQGQLASALGRLMVVSERYPVLKANQNFLALQSQLEGTENRIAVAIKRYNDNVRDFNTLIERFPDNMVNAVFSHKNRVTPFKEKEGADVAPTLKFNSPNKR